MSWELYGDEQLIEIDFLRNSSPKFGWPDGGFLKRHPDALLSKTMAHMLVRYLARTCIACLLDRQFPENLLFGQAKISMKNF